MNQHESTDLKDRDSMINDRRIPISKTDMYVIDLRTIEAQKNFTDSINLCQQTSGLVDKKIVDEGIVGDKATWSRITQSRTNFFPQDRLNEYMDLCKNEAPLIWLARSRGYELVALETEMERRLRHEREKVVGLEQENQFHKKMHTETAVLLQNALEQIERLKNK